MHIKLCIFLCTWNSNVRNQQNQWKHHNPSSFRTMKWWQLFLSCVSFLSPNTFHDSRCLKNYPSFPLAMSRRVPSQSLFWELLHISLAASLDSGSQDPPSKSTISFSRKGGGGMLKQLKLLDACAIWERELCDIFIQHFPHHGHQLNPDPGLSRKASPRLVSSLVPLRPSPHVLRLLPHWHRRVRRDTLQFVKPVSSFDIYKDGQVSLY